jgi:signal transduction histidine kinase
MSLGFRLQNLRTLRGKFLFIVLPALIACFLFFSLIFAVFSYNDKKQYILLKLESYVQTQSAILAKSLWDVNFKVTEAQVNSMLLIPDLSGVKVVEFTTGNTIQAGSLPDLNSNGDFFTVERDVVYQTPNEKQRIGRLTIASHKSNIYKPLIRSFIRDSLLLLLLVFAIIASAMAANRTIMDKPLKLLLRAIRRADEDDVRKHVDWSTRDELGLVISAYNKLVDTLSTAEAALRESEEKLARAKRMEALALLAGGVAHDLNNVLSGIVSYPELLLMELPEDSKLRKPLETMHTSGLSAVAIVHDLLTVARGVAITKEALNLNYLIGIYLKSPEFNKLKQFNPAVTIKTNLGADLFNIFGSRVHIRKVVMNLVSNAAEAISGSGNVTISTENRFVDKPLGGYDDVNIGEYAVMSVSDDGSGISPVDLERIFEPFYTKKVMGRRGTGLGLAVVWNVVQDHEGYIDVKSDGKGTIFELYFPVTRDEISDKDSAVPVEDYKGGGETILVVDDMASQREIACRMLETLGYNAIAVSSGEEAVDYLKEHTVDLILLDMIMDPGINGRETYERIIKIRPNQKAIIASGFAETDDVKETQRLGAGQYLKKPLTLEKVGIAIRDELKK